jgi:hypothetical protein
VSTKHNLAVMTSSKSIEWYTPPELLAEIERFMGSIDLDPARPDASDGLLTTWRGRVFLNPPFGRHISEWTHKALTDPVDELVLLVPARTDTRWFAECWPHTLCFLRGRLKFSGVKESAPFPVVLVYRGPRPEAFQRAFSYRGHVVVNQSPEPAAYQLPLLIA